VAAPDPAVVEASSAGSGLSLVILAAGASTRLGECKALVDLGGRTALARLLEAGADVGSLEPLIVTGAHHESIAAAGPWAGELLHNPGWRRGRSGGLALAAGRRPGQDLCIAPVDTPLVPRALFLDLAAAWSARGRPARGWLAPRCGERHGHPLWLGRDLAARLAELAPGDSLRRLRALADPLWSLATEHGEALDDLDTPADLARLRARILPA
jgi:molybdenum cofactor cytidylyltransferase